MRFPLRFSLVPGAILALGSALASPAFAAAPEQPLNPDGYWSLNLGGALANGQEIERSNSQFVDGFSGDLIQSRSAMTLQNLGMASLRLEVPLNSAISLGFDTRYLLTLVDGFSDSNDLVSGARYFQSLDGDQSGLWLGPNLRIHFSGADWNRPWGEGGSPWGPVLRPTLELSSLFFNDMGSHGSLSSQPGPEFRAGLTLPLASWIAVDAHVLNVYGQASGFGSPPPLVMQHAAFGNEFGLGLRAALPFPNYFQQSDYSHNANPDGRLGIPVLSWELSRFWTQAGPYTDTQRYGLTIPIRPSLSLALRWNVMVPTPELNALRGAYTTSYGVSGQSAFDLALHFYVGGPAEAPEEKMKRQRLKEEKIEKAQPDATPWPKNPDGPNSLELSIGFTPTQELFNDSEVDTWTFFNYNSPGNTATTRDEVSDVITLESASFGGLKFRFPKNPVFSLGAELSLSSYAFKESYNDFTTYTDTSPSSTSYSNYAYSADTQITALNLALPMRFHTSGRQWNIPWGQGGSPWGRLLRPSFDLMPFARVVNRQSENFNDLYLAPGLSAKMTLPLAAWFAVSFGYGVAANLYLGSSGYLYFSSVRLHELDDETGISYEFGLKCGLPLGSWFGPADYAKNANPDGRIGLPVFEAALKHNDDNGGILYQRLQLGLALPVKPWLSLAGHWDQISFSGINAAPYRDQQAFYISPRFYWGSMPAAKVEPPKVIDAGAQMPENHSPESPKPGIPDTEEKK